MTVKILQNTYINNGYTLLAAYSGLTIESNAGVGGTGVVSTHFATIENYGSINSSGQGGVMLTAGGTVNNESGYQGNGQINGIVTIEGASGTVLNSGQIDSQAGNGAVRLDAGGTVYNGASDIGAIIHGGVYVQGGAGAVINAGTITANDDAIKLISGGTVTNGTTIGVSGYILARSIGIYADAAATVTNFGTIHSAGQGGVVLNRGGSVSNGSAALAEALVEGAANGVFVDGAAGTINNFGTIFATSPTNTSGAYLGHGGSLTNGGLSDRSASIIGYTGVSVRGAAGTIANFGTLEGAGVPTGAGILSGTYSTAAGVFLASGGNLSNGALTDQAALILGGYQGVNLSQSGTVNNFGTIEATAAFVEPSSKGQPEVGLSMQAGGKLVNGGVTDTHAVILGYNGVFDNGAGATIANFGTIEGVDAYAGGLGAALTKGGAITNGSVRDSRAVIEGYTGVIVGGTATVTNFGTLIGDGGTAVQLGAKTDTLVEEGGSALIGEALGGGGTLILAAGSGSTASFTAGGDASIAGGSSAASFVNFGIIETGAGSTFTSTTSVVISAAHTLENAGNLVLDAPVSNTGVLKADGGLLQVNAAVSGRGLAEIAAGTLDFTSTFIENVSFLAGSTGTLELADGQAYTGSITGFSTTGATFLDLANFSSAATTATFSGTTSSGTLTVTDGALVAKIKLIGNYTASTFVVASDGHGGSLIHDPTATASAGGSPGHVAPTQPFIQAMAGMTRAAATANPIADEWRATPPMLARPGAQFA